MAPSIITIVMEVPTQQRTVTLDRKAEITKATVHCFKYTQKKARLE